MVVLTKTSSFERVATSCRSDEEDTVNVLLVGVGPHARRTYVPHLVKHSLQFGARLAAMVELESCRNDTEAVCAQYHLAPTRLYTNPFEGSMPCALRERLSQIVEQNRIRAIIISTEPLVHKAYLDFALEKRLNILVDKPLTTRRNAAHNPNQARGIWDDYVDTYARYRESQSRGRPTCLLVNSHRRYHPGFQRVFELIREIRNRTGCPVTSIGSEHCDGQWRLPAEIVSQDYHPYNSGYGKLSHSGYHTLDMVNRFLSAGQLDEKKPDTLSISSSFVLPTGFLKQLTREDYLRYFGADYKQACPVLDDILMEQVAGFGEIDASALLEFRRRGTVVANVNVSLQHNGFSRRTWLQPGEDLYKGNGRVRHERHRIVSGPFQTIVVESYQARDKHDSSDRMDFDLGGNNHFDLRVFRNPGSLSSEEPMQVFRLCDLPGTQEFETGLLYNEQVKEACLVELLRFVRGELEISELRSNIETHELTVRMMSGIYEAHAERDAGKQGWVNADL